jgi:hypothetical protein
MSDQEDIERLTSRLAETDFSAESRIRASLRARLLEKQRLADAAPRSFPTRLAPLVLALAVALMLLLPLRTSAPRKADFPRDELGLPILPGRLVAGGPSAEDLPIEIHRGRAVTKETGSAVIWELDGTTYILETRRISLNDIFEMRAL